MKNLFNHCKSISGLMEAIEQIPQPITGADCIAVYETATKKMEQLGLNTLQKVGVICELNDLELEECNDTNKQDQVDGLECKIKHLLMTGDLLEQAYATIKNDH